MKHKHPVTADLNIQCSSLENMQTLLLWTDPFQSADVRNEWASVCYSVQSDNDYGCTVTDGIGG